VFSATAKPKPITAPVAMAARGVSIARRVTSATARNPAAFTSSSTAGPTSAGRRRSARAFPTSAGRRAPAAAFRSDATDVATTAPHTNATSAPAQAPRPRHDDQDHTHNQRRCYGRQHDEDDLEVHHHAGGPA
jgi:hypothetical protein